MRKLFVVGTLALLVQFGCTPSGEVPPQAVWIVPLDSGNRWIYQYTDTAQQESTIAVGLWVDTATGQPTRTLHQSNSGNTDTIRAWYGPATNDTLFFHTKIRLPPPYDILAIAADSVRYMLNEPAVGDSWQAYFDSLVVLGYWQITVQAIVDANEQLSVPAGDFASAWKVRYVFEATDTTTQDTTLGATTFAWYVKDTGIIQSAIIQDSVTADTLQLIDFSLPSAACWPPPPQF